MKLVVDANPVISLLIRPGLPIEIFYHEDLEFLAPHLLFQEVKRNKETILRKSNITEKEIETFIGIIKKRVTFVPESTFFHHKGEAERICPDKKDTIYFALALSQQCGIWSNEKRLKNQKEVEVYSTHELIERLKIKKK